MKVAKELRNPSENGTWDSYDDFGLAPHDNGFRPADQTGLTFSFCSEPVHTHPRTLPLPHPIL
jgi:hypothetical protein